MTSEIQSFKYESLFQSGQNVKDIFPRFYSEKLSRITISEKGFVKKTPRIRFYYHSKNSKHPVYKLVIVFTHSVPIVAEIYYPEQQFSIKLPVGAFVKRDFIDIQFVEGPLSSSHFFLLSRSRTKKISCLLNPITNIAEAFCIYLSTDYSRYGALRFPNGMELTGINDANLVVAPKKDILGSDGWKAGMLFHTEMA